MLQEPLLVLSPSWAELFKHILGLSHLPDTSEVVHLATRVVSFNRELEAFMSRVTC